MKRCECRGLDLGGGGEYPRRTRVTILGSGLAQPLVADSHGDELVPLRIEGLDADPLPVRAIARNGLNASLRAAGELLHELLDGAVPRLTGHAQKHSLEPRGRIVPARIGLDRRRATGPSSLSSFAYSDM